MPTVNRSAFGQSQQTKSAPDFWSLNRNSAFRANRSSFAITKVALAFLAQSRAAANWGLSSSVFLPLSTSENSRSSVPLCANPNHPGRANRKPV